MVKCLPEFEYFTVFLKNKNIIFKIRRSKVTDYAALIQRGRTGRGTLGKKFRELDLNKIVSQGTLPSELDVNYKYTDVN